MKESYSERNYLEKFASSHLGFFNLDISRISSLFIAEIMYLEKNRMIDVFQILDEIKQLEGVLGYPLPTKKAEVFKREPLKGLMKTHYTDASFIIENINSYFGFQYGGNKKLSNLISNSLSASDNMDKFSKKIGYESTIGALANRAQKDAITGEWIVFQEYKEVNYYLTLGKHNEGDESIYRRVLYARGLDFPFLNSTHSNTM